MGDRYDISVDIGEDNSRSIATLFRIGEDGKYIPLAVSDTISFGSDVEHSGYVGVEAGELSFSAEVVPYSHDALCELFGLRDACIRLLERIEKMATGKRRKTTYKTIRRDCAKRNRHK
jgi:hypothetical protein